VADSKEVFSRKKSMLNDDDDDYDYEHYHRFDRDEDEGSSCRDSENSRNFSEDYDEERFLWEPREPNTGYEPYDYYYD
jgi:hypothetical protein